MKPTYLILRLPNPHQKPTWRTLLQSFRRSDPSALRRAIEGTPKGLKRDLLTEILWHQGRLSKALSAAANLPERRKTERAYNIRFFLSRRHFTHDGTTLTIPAFNLSASLMLRGRKAIKRIWFNADKLFLEMVPASKHGRVRHLDPSTYAALPENTQRT